MTDDKTPDIIRNQTYLDKHHDFKHNKVTGRVEFKKKKDKYFKVLEDRDANSILFEMKAQNYKINSTQLYTILNSDQIESYNPFVEYFFNLPPYDGKNYIKELADTVQTKDQEYWEWCFGKWIVAKVASAIQDNIVNHTVLILQGNQGIGKTTWLNNLVPLILKDYLFEGTIRPGNKDTLSMLASCLLINLDELENLTKRSIGSLKQLITQSQISIRRPYGRNNETMPHRASFAGSVNATQFLNDGTGSRRWLCHEVREIDINHDISIDMVYAQAFDMLSNGFHYWFDKEDVVRINTMNEKFEIRTPTEELLLRHFRKPKPNSFLDPNNLQYLSTTKILDKLRLKAGIQVNQLNTITLGKALSKHSFSKVSKNQRYVWEIIEIDDRTIQEDDKKSSIIDKLKKVV